MRRAIGEAIEEFNGWEPRWQWTGRYLVRRKGKIVRVRKYEVKGKWTKDRFGYETYTGEDYGKEYVRHVPENDLR